MTPRSVGRQRETGSDASRGWSRSRELGDVTICLERDQMLRMRSVIALPTAWVRFWTFNLRKIFCT